MMKQLILLMLLSLAACSPGHQRSDAVVTEASSRAPDTPVLSWDGYGPVLFGMQLEEAENVAGMRTEAERPLDAGCDYIAFTALPGIKFMVENGILTRGEAG